MEESCSTQTSTTLDKQFWETQWQTGETGWDMGRVSPPLKEYIDQIVNKDLAILIPGCGNTYEAEYLLQQGFNNVTVIDISPLLVENLRKKFAADLGKRIEVIEGDFFELKGKYDLVLEQTFFCALEPKLRMKYVWKMDELLSKGGRLVGLLFDKVFDKAGPPFGGSKAEYEMLFVPYFNIHTMATCHNSHPKRAGAELFINLIKS